MDFKGGLVIVLFVIYLVGGVVLRFEIRSTYDKQQLKYSILILF